MIFKRRFASKQPTPIPTSMQNPGVVSSVVAPQAGIPPQPQQLPPAAPHVASYTYAPKLAIPPPQMPQQPSNPTVLNSQYFNKDPQAAHSILDHRHRALPFGIFMIAMVLLGVIGGGYYQLILSKQPGFMLRTAVGKTAGAFDEIVKTTVITTQSGTLKGDYILEGSVATSGTVNMQFHKNNANFSFDIGQPPTRATIAGRLIDSQFSDSPDMYFRASGLKNLAPIAPEYAAALASYDNQWLVVDHTEFDKLKNRYIKTQANGPQLTPDEIAKIMNAINRVNRSYLFTSNAKKAVFSLNKPVGKKMLNDREVYHYSVKLNKDNARNYVNALADALQKTPAASVVAGGNVREAVEFDKLLNTIDGYADTTTADLYVDMQSKLIHTIRFADKGNKQNYLDFGFRQTEKGSLPFVMRLHNTKDGKVSEMSLRMSLNKKTKETDISWMVNSVPVGSKGQKFTTNMLLTPSDTVLTVKRPTNVKAAFEIGAPESGKSIKDLFNTFAVNVMPGSTSSGNGASSDDDYSEFELGEEDFTGGDEDPGLINIPGGDPGIDEGLEPGDDYYYEDDAYENCEDAASC